MLINLKTKADSNQPEKVCIKVTERIPANIKGPCLLNCEYEVETVSNYFLLKLVVDGQLSIICQRCLQEFSYAYANKITLAVCNSDEQAEKLMNDYECVVAKNNQVDFVELLTDELYLYSPTSHLNSKECDEEVNEFIYTDDPSDE